MTSQQTFRSLGSITFAMTKWIKLRQWARRNGQTQTVENCDKWIADCQARGRRIAGNAEGRRLNAEVGRAA